MLANSDSHGSAHSLWTVPLDTTLGARKYRLRGAWLTKSPPAPAIHDACGTPFGAVARQEELKSRWSGPDGYRQKVFISWPSSRPYSVYNPLQADLAHHWQTGQGFKFVLLLDPPTFLSLRLENVYPPTSNSFFTQVFWLSDTSQVLSPMLWGIIHPIQKEIWICSRSA